MVKFLEDELEFPEPFTDARSAMDRISKCYLKSKSITTYLSYVAGVRYVLGPNRVYKDVLIQRRGQGMCQDNTILGADNFRIYHSNTYYFCFHGFKTPTLLEQMVCVFVLVYVCVLVLLVVLDFVSAGILVLVLVVVMDLVFFVCLCLHPYLYLTLHLYHHHYLYVYCLSLPLPLL
jgi:hypothetical protein